MNKIQKTIQFFNGVEFGERRRNYQLNHSPTVYVINSNVTDYISVKTNIYSQNLMQLLDTQADISLIKQSAICNNIFLNDKDFVYIRGFTAKPIKSIGSIIVKFKAIDHTY